MSKYKFNCLVLGDDPAHIFPINIARTDTVGDLKKLVKEEKNAFHDVDADRLKLWNVKNLLVDDHFDDNLKLLLERNGPLSTMKQMDNIFGGDPPQSEHLHIVVDRPPAAVDMINLNCLVLGDDASCIFKIQIASTATVDDLKDMIKEKRTPEFNTIVAAHLELWRVDKLSVEDAIRPELRDEDKISLSPMLRLSEFFKLPKEDRLHIITRRPPSGMHPPPSMLPPPSILVVRNAYADRRIERPSDAATPSKFAQLQKRSLDQVFCNRPRGAADPIPVTLLEPIFAQFVDDCQNYEPTDEDHAFAAELSRRMCDFYPQEDDRLHVFRQIFQKYGITIHPGAVGPSQVRTDGHMLVGTHVKVILEGKNEIGGGGAEPFAEAMLYYRKFLQFVEDRENVFKEHKAVLPCFHIICFGACFGIVGSVFSMKVQCDILVPIIPLFWHSTDLPMEMMTVRTLAALKVAVKKLENFSSTTSNPTRRDGSVICPYPRDYVDSENIQQTFTYDINQSLRERLIFYGKNTNGARVCVKFARTYSPEAHRFCADRGHAPKLIAYKPLSGSWNMIVMEFIDIDPSQCRAGSYQYFSRGIPGIFLMEEPITTLIKALHAEGYVHGDLRDVNIFVQVREGHEGTVTPNFLLIDFDWAGPVDETRYPLGVNRLDIYRPENARGGHRILAKDDLDMVRSLFCPEPSVGQKRKRENPEEAAITSRNT